MHLLLVFWQWEHYSLTQIWWMSVLSWPCRRERRYCCGWISNAPFHLVSNKGYLPYLADISSIDSKECELKAHQPRKLHVLMTNPPGDFQALAVTCLLASRALTQSMKLIPDSVKALIGQLHVPPLLPFD